MSKASSNLSFSFNSTDVFYVEALYNQISRSFSAAELFYYSGVLVA